MIFNFVYSFGELYGLFGPFGSHIFESKFYTFHVMYLCWSENLANNF